MLDVRFSYFPLFLVRVLYFHQYFSTPKGAGGTRSYEMALHLRRRGHQVTMVCAADERSGLDLPEQAKGLRHGTVDDIEVYQFPLAYSNRLSLAQRSLLFFRFALKSVKLALKLDYDVLFATSTPLTAGIPGIVMKLLGRRKSFVFEVRDLWPELPKAMGVVKNPIVLGGMSLLEWTSYRMADACIGLAPGIVEGIRKRSRVSLPVELVPNGCDLELFRPGERARLNLAGVGPTDFVAAFTGAHGIANGLDAVLDAAAVLKKGGRNQIKLVLIGDGNQKDRLRSRARKEGLENVMFLDPLPKLQLSEITGCLDCGLQILANVQAFYYGTSPNKFFDYLAAGRPVLINYPGWLAELVAKHHCGLAVPPDNPGAFAEALVYLADHPEERAEMGRNARRLAETEFARTTLADRWVDFLETTCRWRRAGGSVCGASVGGSAG
jgi:glycosyltransferase involved in cell wall biosynthesis